MYIARKFEALLDAYRRSDGRRWSGQNLHDATGGIVTRSYVTNLRKGRIQNPGYEKLREIANAMGFPPSLWFEDGRNIGELDLSGAAAQRSTIAERVEHLFATAKNNETGAPYTDAEVSHLSRRGGISKEDDLTEDAVRGIRTGEIPNPSVNQVLALADVFGVQPSYFIDNRQLPLDEEIVRALEDTATNEILHKSLRLSSRERDTILGIIQQFEDLHEDSERR